MGIKTATQINETEQNPDIHTCIYTDFQLSCQTNAVREKKTLHFNIMSKTFGVAFSYAQKRCRPQIVFFLIGG